MAYNVTTLGSLSEYDNEVNSTDPSDLLLYAVDTTQTNNVGQYDVSMTAAQLASTVATSVVGSSSSTTNAVVVEDSTATPLTLALSSGTSISVSGFVTAGGLVANAGSVTADGYVSAGTSVTAGTYITAGDYVTAGGAIQGTSLTATTGDVIAAAGNFVATAGNFVADAGYVSAGTYVTAGTSVTAGSSVTATSHLAQGIRQVAATNGVSASLTTWASTSEDFLPNFFVVASTTNTDSSGYPYFAMDASSGTNSAGTTRSYPTGCTVYVSNQTGADLYIGFYTSGSATSVSTATGAISSGGVCQCLFVGKNDNDQPIWYKVT